MGQLSRAFGCIVVLHMLFGGAAHGETKLRVTLQLPPESHLFENLKQFKERVERETGGEVALELYPLAQLFKPNEVRTAVGSGAVDMGVPLLTEYVKVIPEVGIFSIPFLFSQTRVSKAAVAPGSQIRALVENAILADTKARILWWVPYGSYAFVAKGTVISSPSSLDGKTIRVTGETTGELITLCGGVPLIAPGNDQYPLLQSGKVNGTTTGIDIVASRKLWDVADTIALTRHIQDAWPVLINETVWQSLTPAQRTVFQLAAKDAEKTAVEKFEVLEAQVIALAREHGMKIAEVTAEELADWKQCSSPISEAFLSRSGERGQRMMQAYRKVLIDSLRAR